MAKLVFSTIESLDGYVADEAGRFDWAEPDESVHTFINDLERPVGTFLFGRRMYEVMAVWETFGRVGDEPPFIKDYANIWRAANKIVYSTTLDTVRSSRTRIERDFDIGGNMEYRHTQIGWVIIVSMAAAIVLVLAPFFSIGAIDPVQKAVLVILIAALALFYSLSVEINDKTLTCRFGAGIIRKKIPLAEIHHARAVENPWYAGWGIRWMPGQYCMWNVSGLRAVELILKDGKRFRLGTDEPESLVRAIAANKTMGV